MLQSKWKKRSEETQTLRAGCSKVEPKFFAPPQTPFPGTQDGQNLINWRRSLLLPINRVWWGSLLHAISSYRGNRPTNTATNPQRGPITIHCDAKLSTQCNNTATYFIWQNSSGTDISKVMWLEQRNQTDTAGTETAGTVTMQLSTVMLLCTTLHKDQNSYSSII